MENKPLAYNYTAGVSQNQLTWMDMQYALCKPLLLAVFSVRHLPVQASPLGCPASNRLIKPQSQSYFHQAILNRLTWAFLLGKVILTMSITSVSVRATCSKLVRYTICNNKIYGLVWFTCSNTCLVSSPWEPHL